MRLAFIFMLLLNVSFFAWQFFQAEPSSSGAGMSVPKESGRYKTITLLHESGQFNIPIEEQPVQKKQSISSRIGEATAKKEELAKNEIIKCYKLGPFKDKLAADRSLLKARETGAISSLHAEETKERFRYWVLDPARNKQVALKKIKEYRDKGVKDVYLIREGKKKDNISLGIFRARSTAQKRVQKLQDQGFNPTVEKHYKVKTRYWLNVRETLQSPLNDAIWADIIGDAAGIDISDEAC
jgi:hypothetical protein